MKLHELQYLPPVTLAAAQTVYRVQRIKVRPGAVTIGPLKTAPIGDVSGRFALTETATGYFAESPETAVYESLVRREAVLLSISATRRVASCSVCGQHVMFSYYGQDCFVVFGAGLGSFKLAWRKALVLANGSIHQALVTAIRGGQIMLTA